MENKYTIFVGNYLQPKKFGLDLRYIEFSALTRSGFMTREDALSQVQELPEFNMGIRDEVLRRLRLSDEEFQEILKAPIKSHMDYQTYKPRFKDDDEFFKEAMEKGLVPATFYSKYVEGVS